MSQCLLCIIRIGRHLADSHWLNLNCRGSFVIQRKLQESCLAIHKVTSMDDAIDFSKRYINAYLPLPACSSSRRPDG